MRRLAWILVASLLLGTLTSWLGPAPAAAAQPSLRWGYVVTYDASSTASLRAAAGKLDVVSPGFYSLDQSGQILGGDVAEISAIARQGGAKLLPMIQNKPQYGAFTPVLAQPEIRARAISAIVGLVDRYGYDGVHLDFEALRPEDKGALTQFVAELAPQLQARGKLTTIAVPSRVSDAAGAWSAPYDFPELGRLCDYVVIMAYAFRTASNYQPGSISPIAQVDQSAIYTASKMPASKVLLGIGLWGYDWNVSRPGPATSRRYPDTIALGQRLGGSFGYGDAEQSAWLRYSDSSGQHQVWYEDQRSVQAKMGVAALRGLGGFAFWRLGHEDPSVWQLLDRPTAATRPEPVAVAPAPTDACGPTPATPDYAVAGGRFFTQTGGGCGRGFAVVDAGTDPAGGTYRFWSEFQRLGGVDTLGYPVSRRYVGPGGYTYQAFQRGALQWRPESGQALLSNTFEQLAEAGRDSDLANGGIPPAVADDGSGGSWQLARTTRLGWLTDPAILARFNAAPSPALARSWNEDAAIQLYGLPASQPVKSGPFVVQRFQRVSLQLWVEDVPGMPAKGSVVGILGGDLLKANGLIPPEAAQPEGPAS